MKFFCYAVVAIVGFLSFASFGSVANAIVPQAECVVFDTEVPYVHTGVGVTQDAAIANLFSKEALTRSNLEFLGFTITGITVGYPTFGGTPPNCTITRTITYTVVPSGGGPGGG